MTFSEVMFNFIMFCGFLFILGWWATSDVIGGMLLMGSGVWGLVCIGDIADRSRR